MMLTGVVAWAGCGSGGGGSATAAPMTFTDGVAKVDVPLSARRYQMIVAAGRYVVVYGGGARFDGGYTALGDGAVYDTVDETWTRMPEGPFGRPLWGAAGVWSGHEVVIVGTPCDEPRYDEDVGVRCGHAPVAVAFSPQSGVWRRLRLPDVSDGPATGYALEARAVGWTRTGCSVRLRRVVHRVASSRSILVPVSRRNSPVHRTPPACARSIADSSTSASATPARTASPLRVRPARCGRARMGAADWMDRRRRNASARGGREVRRPGRVWWIRGGLPAGARPSRRRRYPHSVVRPDDDDLGAGARHRRAERPRLPGAGGPRRPSHPLDRRSDLRYRARCGSVVGAIDARVPEGVPRADRGRARGVPCSTVRARADARTSARDPVQRIGATAEPRLRRRRRVAAGSAERLGRHREVVLVAPGPVAPLALVEARRLPRVTVHAVRALRVRGEESRMRCSVSAVSSRSRWP